MQATFLETQAAAALEAAEAVADAELAGATGNGEPNAKLISHLIMSSTPQVTLSREGTGRSEALKAALLRTASTSSSAYRSEVRVPSYALTHTCVVSFSGGERPLKEHHGDLLSTGGSRQYARHNLSSTQQQEAAHAAWLCGTAILHRALHFSILLLKQGDAC